MARFVKLDDFEDISVPGITNTTGALGVDA